MVLHSTAELRCLARSLLAIKHYSFYFGYDQVGE